ncbi:hypothetical protein ADUPG1_008912, partial [Aduncisulcus paluster]
SDAENLGISACDDAALEYLIDEDEFLEYFTFPSDCSPSDSTHLLSGNVNHIESCLRSISMYSPSAIDFSVCLIGNVSVFPITLRVIEPIVQIEYPSYSIDLDESLLLYPLSFVSSENSIVISDISEPNYGTVSSISDDDSSIIRFKYEPNDEFSGCDSVTFSFFEEFYQFTKNVDVDICVFKKKALPVGNFQYTRKNGTELVLLEYDSDSDSSEIDITSLFIDPFTSVSTSSSIGQYNEEELAVDDSTTFVSISEGDHTDICESINSHLCTINTNLGTINSSNVFRKVSVPIIVAIEGLNSLPICVTFERKRSPLRWALWMFKNVLEKLQKSRKFRSRDVSISISSKASRRSSFHVSRRNSFVHNSTAFPMVGSYSMSVSPQYSSPNFPHSGISSSPASPPYSTEIYSMVRLSRKESSPRGGSPRRSSFSSSRRRLSSSSVGNGLSSSDTVSTVVFGAAKILSQSERGKEKARIEKRERATSFSSPFKEQQQSGRTNRGGKRVQIVLPGDEISPQHDRGDRQYNPRAVLHGGQFVQPPISMVCVEDTSKMAGSEFVKVEDSPSHLLGLGIDGAHQDGAEPHVRRSSKKHRVVTKKLMKIGSRKQKKRRGSRSSRTEPSIADE